LLIRGDKNPNTNGLKQALAKNNISTKWSELEASLKAGKVKHLVVVGPENLEFYKDIAEKVSLFTQAQNLIYATTVKVDSLMNSNTPNTITVVPLKSFVEKDGTFVNHAGVSQSFKKATIVVSEALNAAELSQLLAGESLKIENVNEKALFTAVSNTRKDQVTLDHRKKNEFVFNRGRL
jgi:NADH-quinone oxidoreductase subunit G